MDWKKTYIDSLIDALQPSGDVLEVGFGKGYAANRIQSKKPKSHTIIESDPEIAEMAKKWAASHPNVKVIQDNWQHALPKLGKFDAIFYNDSPAEGAAELIRYTNVEEAKAAGEKAKKALHAIEKELSDIAAHYTDEEIDDFYKKIGQFKMSELPKFFTALKDRGHISEKQYKNVCKKYNLDKAHDEPQMKDSNATEPLSNMHLFLQKCIPQHMNKGSRFSCFSSDPQSKYQDSQFFEHFITNTDLDYEEKYIPIDVPQFRTIEALVMVVKKVA